MLAGILGSSLDLPIFRCTICRRRRRHFYRTSWRSRESGGQNLHALLGDEQSVFELCGTGSICCDSGPVVWPGLILVRAQADHGFNGEGHSHSAFTNSLVFGIVRYIRRAVEQFVDSVTTVRLHNAEFLRFGMLFDDIAKIANLDPWLDVLD